MFITTSGLQTAPEGVDNIIAAEVDTSTLTTDSSVKEKCDIVISDPVLAQKMALVNDAIDEIGMTPFHWKLFFLNGFGYAVESVSYNNPRHALYANMLAFNCLCFNRQSSSHKGIRHSD